MIKKLLRRPYHFFRLLWRLNILATLWFNFRVLPFSKAIKLPFFLFGKIKFHYLRGVVIINAPIRTGMIKIGYRWFDLWPTSFLPTQIVLNGKMVFNGSCIISGGVYISSFLKNSILDIGANTTIGGGALVKATELIVIENRTRIAGNCTILDSNMHFVKDLEKGTFSRKNGNIHIGHNCWINAGSVVTKGAVIPPYSILARNSFIGKDFTQYGECCMFAGAPAKMIKKGVQRIFNPEIEHQINTYFYDHPEEDIYTDKPGITSDF